MARARDYHNAREGAPGSRAQRARLLLLHRASLWKGMRGLSSPGSVGPRALSLNAEGPNSLYDSAKVRGREEDKDRVPDGNPRERQKPSITRTGSFERRLWGRVAGLESCPDQGLTAL